MKYKYADEVGPIKTTELRDWWICFTQFNGKPGKAGPYSRAEAEHRMRSTHWRPGSGPRYERSTR